MTEETRDMTAQAEVEAPTTPEIVETPVAEEAQAAAHAALFDALKDAGEAGKKEWEEILGRARSLFAEERRNELKSTVNEAFARAQGRGAFDDPIDRLTEIDIRRVRSHGRPDIIGVYPVELQGSASYVPVFVPDTYVCFASVHQIVKDVDGQIVIV